MLKIFLVEDESIVREGLRDNIPWQQFGYEFVGEASDGEMALPLIRKTQPDILITDIKMPFMDGLSLSRIVSQEFPNTKIIIISGYDDFEYARQAIHVGVEQYLLKPITRSTLQKVLSEIREKIESEKEQKNYLEKFQSEMHEYEQLSRRNFFEKVFAGEMSVQEIYEAAQKLSMELNASCYNLVMFSLEKQRNECQEELMRFFLRYPEYLVFRWNVSTYGILIKGDDSQMEESTDRCVENIKRICEGSGEELEWYVAVGTKVERLSMLPQCYSKVNHALAFRFLVRGQHIFSEKDAERFSLEAENKGIGGVDAAKVDPEILKSFLSKGQNDEIEEFVSGYLLSLSEPIKSKLFRDYLMLSTRFICIAYVESLGYSQAEFLEAVHMEHMQELSLSEEEVEGYMVRMIRESITLRNQERDNQGKQILKHALSYIEENFTLESISLNSVASATKVSANYFSAIFSQEMKVTFTEYVTQKRMELAKKLLRQTEKPSGEIAGEIGYKDPHYFSFVFKKTQGVTPREFRNMRS